MHDIFYQVALSLVPGVGTYSARQLLTYCGNAKTIFTSPAGKLKKIPGIRENITVALQDSALLKQAEQIILQCEKQNISVVFLTDPLYPRRLKEIPDAPLILYHKGCCDLNAKKIVGIVGTRKATAYGKECVERIIAELSTWSPIIVSGLAYGIDIAAHKISLDMNLHTIGVLGSGIARIYPDEHRSIAQRMCEQGALVSEYQPHRKAELYHFPARNRIIAGLCDGIVVAEAAEKGGALITAELANAYHREVMAIPGNLTYNTSLGCHNLIKNNQAHLITSGQDIAQLLNWDINTTQSSKFKLRDTALIDALSDDERTLYLLIERQECIQMDELAWQSNIPISRTANLLLQLEMQGFIKMLAGKKIKIA
jgi:DNA processing protein